MTGADSRRLGMRFLAVAPLLLVAGRFACVLIEPGAAANREWLDDARILLRFEFLLLAAPLLVLIAGDVAGRHRPMVVGFMVALLAALLAMMWRLAEGSPVFWAAAMLLASRFVSGALGGRAMQQEILQRWGVSTAVFLSLLLGAIILFPPPTAYANEGVGFAMTDVTICAAHYFLLALVELSGTYAPERLARHPAPANRAWHAFIFLLFMWVPGYGLKLAIDEGHIHSPLPWVAAMVLVTAIGAARLLVHGGTRPIVLWRRA